MSPHLFPALPRLRCAGLCLLLLLGGCIGPKSVGTAAPDAKSAPAAPRSAETTAEREHESLVAAFGGEYRFPAAESVLGDMVARLVRASERPSEGYRVTVLDSPVVNAFALPSGRLYVTRGLLALAGDAAEMAAVLAHEIAHVTLRHANARTELAARSALVSRVVQDVLGDPSAGATLRDQSQFRLASFSREQEFEADRVGVRTLAAAGYDPYGAVRFLRALERLSGSRPGARDEGASPDMLASHPGTSERLRLVRLAARRIAAPGIGREDRAPYLAAIDGLAYGENPADGVVRGRRFLHPRLRIAFDAPAGFQLENTARAVLGTTADGNRRLLFDAIEPAAGQSLEQVLRSTWSDQIETGSIEAATVNGAPAATAASRGKEWSFRLAAVQTGSGTFRLIVAGRALTPDLDQTFRRTLDSIRVVGAEEAQALKPLRLRLVTAAPGDTAERLAARMAPSEQSAERFMVLNGLERGDALRPGETYKIVVE